MCFAREPLVGAFGSGTWYPAGSNLADISAGFVRCEVEGKWVKFEGWFVELKVGPG